ncbi:MAG: hypothetical protein HYS13_09150 [Planctomycetia bacterium]|nr:hypothetical protein [Planctomycetia bacterium]
MTLAAEKTLQLSELAEIVARADPAAFVVEARVLKRLIKYDRRITGLGLAVPHRKTYVASREALLEVVEPDELHPRRPLPDRLILLAEPDSDEIDGLSRGEVLRTYWRRLFHARVHFHLEEELAEGRLTRLAILERIHRIGQSEFDEIAAVLRAEGFLLPPRDDATVYVEFAAMFLELRFFDPELMPRYFPSLAGVETAASGLVESVLDDDVDGQALLNQTRLEGSAERTAPSTPAPRKSADEGRPPSGRRSDAKYERLMRRAEQTESHGNVVRAALLRTKAVAVASPKQASDARSAAEEALRQLVRRLQKPLDLDHSAGQKLLAALRSMLERAPAGRWTHEARFLYDLQKVCVDDEREIFKVGLGAWLLSRGRRPIRRPLPQQREVLISKHLRSAAARLAKVRVSDAHRESLEGILRDAHHHAEDRMRKRLRPHILRTLEDVGLVPHGQVEEVSRDKLVEELLDRVAVRGYANFGDLRDAVAANHVKLPDLVGPKEFILGDKLLRADGKLNERLDGVYHGSEVYLRHFQRASSLAFGNPVGRLVMRYGVLPFAGAYMLLEFFVHMLHYLPLHRAPGFEWLASRFFWIVQSYFPLHGSEMTALCLGSVGVFLLLILNFALFRRAVGQGIGSAWSGTVTGVRFVGRLFALPLIQRILASRAFFYVRRYVIRPLVVTALLWLAVRLSGGSIAQWSVWHVLQFVVVFLILNLVLNIRAWRDFEERFADYAGRAWLRFRVYVLANIYYFIVDLFRLVLEQLDRLLYAVDEWLRFKQGETALTFYFKLTAGSLWSVVTYVVRFSVNLLIEPQINPLKHFPVVTVSHKLILPLAVSTSWSAVPSPLASGVLFVLPISVELANWLALSVVWGIPGIFGFIAWELKNNWRLYAANRGDRVRPVIIGSHGETMRRLIKPGFHSGTLPKLYRKLLRAERKAHRGGSGQAVRKLHDALAHVEESIAHYVERELIALLARSPRWKHRLELAGVATASNTVRISLRCEEFAEPPLMIAFDEHSGWILARVAQPGFLPRLDPLARNVLRNALVGLYKTSGVDLVCEQIESLLRLPDAPPTATSPGGSSGYHAFDRLCFDVSPEGLVVWPDRTCETEAIYDLESEMMAPQIRGHAPVRPLPALVLSDVLFSERPLYWPDWTAAWEDGRRGDSQPPVLLPDVNVFPTA